MPDNAAEQPQVHLQPQPAAAPQESAEARAQGCSQSAAVSQQQPVQMLGSTEALRAAVADRLQQAPRSTPAFLLASSPSQVTGWQRWYAGARPISSFGVDIDTLEKHAEGRWSLFGDGRIIVDQRARMLLAARTVQDCFGVGTTKLQPTTGLVRTLTTAAREGFCYPDFRAKVAERASAGEKIFSALAHYAELLDRQNQVEYGEALLQLSSVKHPSLVLVGVGLAHVLPAEAAYLRSVNAQLFDLNPSGGAAQSGIPALVAHLYAPGAPLAPSAAIRFATASGPYAEPPLIARLAAEYIEGGCAPTDLFIACARPADVFKQVAPRLAKKGVSATGSMRDTFGGTLLGRTFLGLRAALRSLAGEGELSHADIVAYLSDYATSVFSSFAPEDIFDFDEKLRGRRLKSVDDAVHALRKQNNKAGNGMDKVCCALEEGRDAKALLLLYRAARDSGRLDAVQLAICASAQKKGTALLADMARMELDEPLALQLLSETSVSISCTMEADVPATAGAVRFGSLEDLAAEGAHTAIICQMTTEGFPLAVKGDPLNSLFARLGLTRQDTTLTDMRASFKCALDAVGDAVVLERVLNEADADPARASVLMEEAVDCFRADITATDDLDEKTGLPLALLSARIDGVALCDEEGENNLVALAPAPFGSASCEEDTRATQAVGDQTAFDLSPVTAQRLSLSGAEEPRFSASQIESYLACPYKWFLLRKVKPEPLDQENDLAAYGSFVHGALDAFYRRFSENGPRRVTQENLDEALALLDEEFDRLRDNPPGSIQNPVILEDEFDRRTLEQLRVKVHELLKNDIEFLPGYTPERFETPFGGTSIGEHKVVYAGYAFRGQIDRIDVGETGPDGRPRAVIIDYKGALDSSYSPSDKDGTIDVPHVQSLIYAQIVQREFGYDVLGTLYRSYKDAQVQGARAALLEVGQPFKGKPYTDKDAEAFQKLLDDTEANVEAAIERLLKGNIAPNPAGPSSCDYCPAQGTCQVRKGAEL